MFFLPLLLNLPGSSSTAMTIDLFVGTYTSSAGSKGIYRAELDTQTGKLSDLGLVAEAINPSYLAINRSGDHLYAVDESADGKVSAYTRKGHEKLTLLNTMPSGGSAPCHLALDSTGKALMVANYGNGTLDSFVLNSDGSLGASAGVFQNSGSGPNRGRQEGPHMHWIESDPSGKFACACDLGTDEVLVYRFNAANGDYTFKNPKRVKARAGQGPRHGVFDKSGSHLYIVNELASTVSVFLIDANGGFEEVQNLSTLPSDFSGFNSTTAEIALSPNGKWLYASNRGHDSIAVFEVQGDGQIKLIEIKRLTVKEPRGFAIDPTGKWLVVGGQSTHDLASLRIDPTTGMLTELSEKLAIHSPVCVLFAP